MKVTQVGVWNFNSYKELVFNYSDLGLTLVCGDTGAGKSTFMDAVAWVLFGITGKDGAADDVNSWGSTEETGGIARVQLHDGEIVVRRRRGATKDLQWCEVKDDVVANSPNRGKDLVETQKLLEKRLGVAAEVFLVGSYMTQFSKADSFFIAKSRDRRAILEKIADQEFAIELGERTAELRKTVKKDLQLLEVSYAKTSGKVDSLERFLADWTRCHDEWNVTQKQKLVELSKRSESFNELKVKRIEELQAKADMWDKEALESRQQLTHKMDLSPKPQAQDSDWTFWIDSSKEALQGLQPPTCPTCGGAADGGDAKVKIMADIQTLTEGRLRDSAARNDLQVLKKELTALDATINPHLSALHRCHLEENVYSAQLDKAWIEFNPYFSKMNSVTIELGMEKEDLEVLNARKKEQSEEYSSLTWLYDKSFELRGLVMARTVEQIEAATNAYLERYFDAALRVKFTLEGSDSLELEIHNQGYATSFKSLSGGERCMLKLCFSLSLMKAAQDKAGIQFGMILLDEPFNGLSESLKVRAFGLLQQLATQYGTVLVIDHSSELKSQFSKIFLVDKSSGYSEIYEQ